MRKTSEGSVQLWSRAGNLLNRAFPEIVDAVAGVDGIARETVEIHLSLNHYDGETCDAGGPAQITLNRWFV